MQYAPTRIHEKPARFHISAHGYTKNAPDFTLSNKDIPKSCPILGANLRRRTFRGVCFCAPTRVRAKFSGFHTSASEYVKNPPGFIFPHPDKPKTHPVLAPNLRRGYLRGVCFCAPTRVYEKFGGFHISPSEYTKNVPDLTLPNKDSPKTCPILDPNPCRRTFRGVCFCALHGYVQNLAGFIFPHTT